MKIIPFCLLAALCFSLTACGQKTKQPKKNNSPAQTTSMDMSAITNPVVKQAIEALQANDSKKWYSYFTGDAVFTDDGRTQGFKSFFDNAFDKKEKFLSIDKVENEGKDVYGNFYAGQWGTFRVFFKFHINDDGKINRLDIGQGK